MEKLADKEELLLVLDENGNSTGKLEKRSVVHKNNLWHNEVAIWILDNEHKKVLLQRRSPNKKQNPNKLALCAGHVVGYDTIEDTLKTELKEELGLNIEEYEVKKLIVLRREMTDNFNFSHSFYIEKCIPISEITIQEEELSEVLYMDYDELKTRVQNADTEFVFKWETYKPIFDIFDKIFYNEKK